LVVEHGVTFAGRQHRDVAAPDKVAQMAHRLESVFRGDLFDRLADGIARHRGRASGLNS
jgi:hypothetical protein